MTTPSGAPAAGVDSADDNRVDAQLDVRRQAQEDLAALRDAFETTLDVTKDDDPGEVRGKIDMIVGTFVERELSMQAIDEVKYREVLKEFVNLTPEQIQERYEGEKILDHPIAQQIIATLVSKGFAAADAQNIVRNSFVEITQQSQPEAEKMIQVLDANPAPHSANPSPDYAAPEGEESLLVKEKFELVLLNFGKEIAEYPVDELKNMSIDDFGSFKEQIINEFIEMRKIEFGGYTEEEFLQILQTSAAGGETFSPSNPEHQTRLAYIFALFGEVFGLRIAEGNDPFNDADDVLNYQDFIPEKFFNVRYEQPEEVDRSLIESVLSTYSREGKFAQDGIVDWSAEQIQTMLEAKLDYVLNNEEYKQKYDRFTVTRKARSAGGHILQTFKDGIGGEGAETAQNLTKIWETVAWAQPGEKEPDDVTMLAAALNLRPAQIFGGGGELARQRIVEAISQYPTDGNHRASMLERLNREEKYEYRVTEGGKVVITETDPEKRARAIAITNEVPPAYRGTGWDAKWLEARLSGRISKSFTEWRKEDSKITHVQEFVYGLRGLFRSIASALKEWGIEVKDWPLIGKFVDGMAETNDENYYLDEEAKEAAEKAKEDKERKEKVDKYRETAEGQTKYPKFLEFCEKYHELFTDIDAPVEVDGKKEVTEQTAGILGDDIEAGIDRILDVQFGENGDIPGNKMMEAFLALDPAKREAVSFENFEQHVVANKKRYYLGRPSEGEEEGKIYVSRQGDSPNGPLSEWSIDALVKITEDSEAAKLFNGSYAEYFATESEDPAKKVSYDTLVEMGFIKDGKFQQPMAEWFEKGNEFMWQSSLPFKIDKIDLQNLKDRLDKLEFKIYAGKKNGTAKTEYTSTANGRNIGSKEEGYFFINKAGTPVFANLHAFFNGMRNKKVDAPETLDIPIEKPESATKYREGIAKIVEQTKWTQLEVREAGEDYVILGRTRTRYAVRITKEVEGWTVGNAKGAPIWEDELSFKQAVILANLLGKAAEVMSDPDFEGSSDSPFEDQAWGDGIDLDVKGWFSMDSTFLASNGSWMKLFQKEGLKQPLLKRILNEWYKTEGKELENGITEAYEFIPSSPEYEEEPEAPAEEEPETDAPDAPEEGDDNVT